MEEEAETRQSPPKLLQTPEDEQSTHANTNPRTPKPKSKSTRKPTLDSPPVSSRCTRSQSEPEWSVHEVLVLVSQVAAVNQDFHKNLPSHQKWRIISDNCHALDVVRTFNQCKRKWEQLLVDHKKIKDWELRSGAGSYWGLGEEKKREFGLPVFLDREVFGVIDDCFRAQQEASSDSEMDSDSEVLVNSIEAGMHDVALVPGSKKETRSRPSKSKVERNGEMGRNPTYGPNFSERNGEMVRNPTYGPKEKEMLGKLQDGAQRIHAILRGDLTESLEGNKISVDAENTCEFQTEFIRRQGDELIKVLGTLVGNLDQLAELVRERG